MCIAYLVALPSRRRRHRQGGGGRPDPLPSPLSGAGTGGAEIFVVVWVATRKERMGYASSDGAAADPLRHTAVRRGASSTYSPTPSRCRISLSPLSICHDLASLLASTSNWWLYFIASGARMRFTVLANELYAPVYILQSSLSSDCVEELRPIIRI